MNWLIYLKTCGPFWMCIVPVWIELQACSGCGDESENVCWLFFHVKMHFFFHVKVLFFFHVKLQFFFCHCNKTKKKSHWRLCSFHALCHVLAEVSSGKLITRIHWPLFWESFCPFLTNSSNSCPWVLQCEHFSVWINDRITSPTNSVIQANGCRSRGGPGVNLRDNRKI